MVYVRTTAEPPFSSRRHDPRDRPGGRWRKLPAGAAGHGIDGRRLGRARRGRVLPGRARLSQVFSVICDL